MESSARLLLRRATHNSEIKEYSEWKIRVRRRIFLFYRAPVFGSSAGKSLDLVIADSARNG